MHKKARAHALQLIKKFPDSQFYPEAQIILANTYIQTNVIDKATEILQNAVTTITSSARYKRFQSYLPDILVLFFWIPFECSFYSWHIAIQKLSFICRSVILVLTPIKLH